MYHYQQNEKYLQFYIPDILLVNTHFSIEQLFIF